MTGASEEPTAAAVPGPAPASGALVEVDGLTFRYRRATEPAIREVSLTVAPGEVLLVAGPSGCGKSTLIRAINGLIPHAYSGDMAGTVRIDGALTTEVKLRDLARSVGTVLQDPAKQIVGATVEAELAFGPENLGIPRDEIRDRIREVAEAAGIQRLLGRETFALSGGERQLLAVAGILMLRPKLFVVDEPLANLDPATAERLLTLLRRLADEGSAIVIVEHRVEESLDLHPDRVLYLENGSTRYLGPVDGFLDVADPESVKLPFDVVGRRVAAGSPDEEPTAVTLRERQGEDRDATPRLEFRDVTAAIGEKEILHGVDARLGSTETVAVLGPNGSGKTTLFRTAMRLLDITGGAVVVDGRSIA
ncbi:MAG TPA: ABC transporter ATP-binding protein, partial [Candidatus Limnocylindrales bacterium]|nr:ABC transporter ATP-binding protein [Candidatus Limnocylindrales bacterium]